MNPHIPPLKIEYSGEIGDLPNHLINMGQQVRDDDKIPFHSLCVVLKGNEIDMREELIRLGKEQGYHIISLKGKLSLCFNPSKGDDFLNYQDVPNTHTLLFYTEPELAIGRKN